jgi:hypothetical protein
MSEIFWKLVRFALPAYAAAAVIVAYCATGWSRWTCGLVIFATTLLLTWRIWNVWVLERFELPASRRLTRELASDGILSILFLRSFAVERYWRQLQEFILDAVRAHNRLYADHKTVVAIGDDDNGVIAKLASTESDWWPKVSKFGGTAEAIVILPVHPAPKATSGLVHEIAQALLQYLDKAIFVMPPAALWDGDLKATPLAGQLERLWAEMVECLRQRSPSITLLPYEAAGCFWTMHKGHHAYEATTYTYSQEGAKQVLFRVLDEQRVRQNLLMMEHDPEGYEYMKRRRSGNKGGRLPTRHTLT